LYKQRTETTVAVRHSQCEFLSAAMLLYIVVKWLYQCHHSVVIFMQCDFLLTKMKMVKNEKI